MEIELDVLGWESQELATALAEGLAFFAIPAPVRMDKWADEHYYLSKESNYVEQHWRPWAFQIGILICMGHDGIRDFDLKKSARVGYTRILLAAIGYFSEHKRRNMAVWLPTDGDRDAFAKTDIDPFLRDVKILHRVFIWHLSRNSDNTLELKRFLGGLLHLKGGTAGGNYRRITVDVGIIDELDAFDRDIEGEGSPITLAKKRVEGATFPKFVTGSTPKIKGFSQIDERFDSADVRMYFCISCPSCESFHSLEWGKDDIRILYPKGGMRWVNGDPETVLHACPHCGALIDQGQYLALSRSGRWQTEDGSLILDGSGQFINAIGTIVQPPKHIAMHVWTAYSELVSWPTIVADYIKANAKLGEGDDRLIRTFINTTVGLSYSEKVEKTNKDLLKERAAKANYTKGVVPVGCVLLLAGCDTQNDRVEIVVWGFGRGLQMWCIAYEVIYGNPAEKKFWDKVAEYLFKTTFRHVSGQPVPIYASAIDSGGAFTQEVYSFVDDYPDNRIYAVKGASATEKSIAQSVSLVDIKISGKKKKNGLKLWFVGTNLAKNRLYGRLQVEKPGNGYVNFYRGLSDEFFNQMAGEDRFERVVQGGTEYRWTPNRKRQEAWDCSTYVIWLEIKLGLEKKFDSYWDALESQYQPPIRDLFYTAEESADVCTDAKPIPPQPPAAVVPPVALPPPLPVENPFADNEWLQRGFQ